MTNEERLTEIKEIIQWEWREGNFIDECRLDDLDWLVNRIAELEAELRAASAAAPTGKGK